MAAGRRRKMGIINSRLKSFKAKRARKIAQAKKAKGPALLLTKMVYLPSILYGSSVHGVTNSLLRIIRTQIATSVQGNSSGRSTTLTLLAEGIDPGVLANIAPIAQWARSWQDVDKDSRQRSYLQRS